MECKQRRRYKTTTQSNHVLPVAVNTLNREFTVAEPNRAWASAAHFWETIRA